MKLTFLCLGSRGDVQPYIALGLGFQRLGYRVRIATHEIFKDFVTQYGLEFSPVQGNPRQFVDLIATSATFSVGNNFIKLIQELRKIVRQVIQHMLDSSITACEGSDVLFYGLLSIPAYHLADKWNIPRFPVLLQPATRTGAYPAAVFPALPLGPLYNHLTWMLYQQSMQVMLGSYVDKWRRQTLGLPRLSPRIQPNESYLRKLPYIYGFSEHIMPRPVDYPAWHHIAGYWFLDQPPSWKPPADLINFIRAGTPPVYVGFGSMSAGDAQRVTRIVLEALRANRQRAILLKGWGGLHVEDVPDSVYMVENIPHDWLFPQMSAITHHGGAGTTAAALRAGMPQVIIPHLADQPFWAQRVHDLGASPKPVSMNHLDSTVLASAIQQAVSDRQIRQRAKTIGQKICLEDGVGRALEIIEGYLRSAGG